VGGVGGGAGVDMTRHCPVQPLVQPGSPLLLSHGLHCPFFFVANSVIAR
jgi:hypothetical protein